MIGATLRLPTIDKMNFWVRPEFCDVTRSALRKYTDRRTKEKRGENKQILYYFNYPETGIYFTWSKCEGLHIDCNPNNIGDPDDIMKIYKLFGVGLPDPYTWELNRIDIERNQQLNSPANAYFLIMDRSLGPKMRRTDPKPYPTTYTTGSRESNQMQFYDKTAERKARGKTIDANNVMRLEFRFMKARVIKKLGIQTAGDLYGMGTDFLTTVYRQQFDRFLPGLPSFAGDNSGTTDGYIINDLIGLYDSILLNPDRTKNPTQEFLNVICANMLTDGVKYTTDQVKAVIEIFSDSKGIDRRIKSKNIKVFKDLLSLPYKYGAGDPVASILAKELLSFAS